MIVEERGQFPEGLIRAARRAAVLQQAVREHGEAERLRQRAFGRGIDDAAERRGDGGMRGRIE